MASYKIKRSSRQEQIEEDDFDAPDYEVSGQEERTADTSDISAIEQLLASGENEKVSRGMREIKGMKEGAWLEYFAATSPTSESRIAAVNALGLKSEELKTVAEISEHSDSKSVALDRLAGMLEDLDDEDGLRLLANEHESQEVRLAAASKVQSNSKLKEIAESSSFEDSRWHALKRLDLDQAKKVKRTMNIESGKKIFSKSANREDALLSMKKLIANYYAVKNVYSKNEVVELSQTAKSDVEFYTNAIVHAACFGTDSEVRGMAVKSLSKEPEALLEISIHSEYPDSGALALSRLDSLGEKITDEKILFQLAKKSPSWQNAVDRIENTQTLVKLFKSMKGQEKRDYIMEKLEGQVDEIKDKATLQLIFKFSDSEQAKRSAGRKLKISRPNQATITAIKPEEHEPEEEIETKRFVTPTEAGLVGQIKAFFKEFIGL